MSAGDACGNGAGIVDPGSDTFTVTSPERVRRGSKLAEMLSGSQETLSLFITVTAHGAVVETVGGVKEYLEAGTQERKLKLALDRH